MSKTIAVVHGGTTHEREKSLQYGKTVSKIFRDAGNNIVEIHLHPNGSWTRDGKLQNLEQALDGIPVLWNALVGADGEKGLVEKLCAKCKVKLLGHSTIHTEIAANKKTLKEVLKQHKIKTPYAKKLLKKDLSKENIKYVFQMVGVPMIVKPLVGSGKQDIFFANNFTEYKEALEQIFSSGSDVLVEKPVLGKHVNVFVFKSKNLTHAHVYSAESLSRDESLKIRNEALYIQNVLGYEYHVKYDFVLNDKGLYLLEMNTHSSLVHDEIKSIYQKGEINLSEYLLGVLD